MTDVEKLEFLKAARDAARAAAYADWTPQNIAAWMKAAIDLVGQAKRMASKVHEPGSARWNECVSALLD